MLHIQYMCFVLRSGSLASMFVSVDIVALSSVELFPLSLSLSLLSGCTNCC